jgi:hypothetical protein
MEGIIVKLIVKYDSKNDGEAAGKNPREKVTK